MVSAPDPAEEAARRWKELLVSWKEDKDSGGIITAGRNVANVLEANVSRRSANGRFQPARDWLGNLCPHLEAIFAPPFGVQDDRALLHGTPNVCEPKVQGGETEADHVGGAEIPDDTNIDQGLAEMAGARVTKGNVTSPS